MRRLRKHGKDIRLRVEPTTLLLRLWEDVTQRFPEAQRALADREERGAHAAAAAVAQQVTSRCNDPIASQYKWRFRRHAGPRGFVQASPELSERQYSKLYWPHV